MTQLIYGVDSERVKALCEADKKGRIVITPYKVKAVIFANNEVSDDKIVNGKIIMTK